MVRQSAVRAAFWTLVVISAVVASQFFVPAVGDIFEGSMLFLLPPALFSALGLCLTVLAARSKLVGWLKRFLLITGVSAAGFLVFIVLHNVFYGLAQLTADTAVLSHLTEALHVAFFLAAIIACPLGFVVGALGSIVLFVTTPS